MAIVIPSKHIYDIKKSNIVLDNKIDRIEYKEKEIALKTEIDNVYNTSISEGFYEGEGQDEVNTADYLPPYGREWAVSCAYVKQIPIYVRKTISIIKQNDKALTAPLNFSTIIYGKIISGNATGENVAQYIQSDYIISTMSDIQLLPAVDEVENGIISIDNIKSVKAEFTYSGEYAYAEIDYTDTLTEVELKENNSDSYLIDCFFVCGFINVELTGGATLPFTSPLGTPLTIPLTGEYTKYIPTTVNISFRGHKLSLDIKESDLVIGNGENIYRYDSNELIQSTNTPKIENNLQSIITEWREGKETATITCGIADYYDRTDDILTLYGKPYMLGNMRMIAVKTNNIDRYTTNEKIKLSPYDGEFTVRSILDNIMTLICPFTEVPQYTTFSCNNGNKLKDINTSNMSFKLFDKVIPYVYNNKGVDEPLSLDIDGNPKEFEVVSRRIYYKGVPLQEIKIREV